jgi:triacylglycerol lipase
MATARGYTAEELRQAEDFHTMALPLWREALVGMDWLSLRASAVYRGIGVPHGDGSAVVLVPGFLGSDQYLGDLFSWLRRMGYQPHMSGIGRVADCPNVLVERLFETIDQARAQSHRRIHLIGHSLGGVLVRSAAARWPDYIASIITMGSPFRGVRAHPLIVGAGRFIGGRIRARHEDRTGILPDCFTGKCSCESVKALRRRFPDDIPHTAIYTKTDGVIDWRRCVNEDPDWDVEVAGTHVGLVFNPQVYRHIAERLALASAPRPQRKPSRPKRKPPPKKVVARVPRAEQKP